MHLNIPNLPALSPVVDDDKNRTPVEQIFMQQLITQLQQNAGPEGLVAPTQTNVAPNFNITTIQNNQLDNGEYTCAFGTFLYNATTNSIIVTIDDGTGKPVFKTVTVT